MDLKTIVDRATLSYRDVDLALDGARVYERELLLNQVAASKRRLIDLDRQRRQQLEREDPDSRLSQPDEAITELDSEIQVLTETLNSTLTKISELETEMLDAQVTFRFTALPKHTFEELRTQAAGDITKTYSLIARASGRHVNGDSIEKISDDVWDQLEQNLTAGQWAHIIDAIDTVNVTEGRQGLGFLNGSALTKTSVQN